MIFFNVKQYLYHRRHVPACAYVKYGHSILC